LNGSYAGTAKDFCRKRSPPPRVGPSAVLGARRRREEVKRVYEIEKEGSLEPDAVSLAAAAGLLGGKSITELDLDEIKREARLEVEALLRRCVIELVYINDGVENCDSGLCATGEGKECISEAVRLLGPVATWPEIAAPEEVEKKS
jgi:hypothetical protein